MAEVESARALLIMALNDLYDGETAMVDRLPTVRKHGEDAAFRALIADDEGRSAEQKRHLESLLRALDAEPGGSENIWLRAILDDAGNDAETIARGPLRDIALVGALRKAKQSERVSYETAIALAHALAMEDATAALISIRDEERATDDALAGMLERLTSGPLPQA